MPLTDLACRKTRPSERLKKHSDMNGLQLWIFPNGSKLWRYAYRFAGKQKLLALGRFPEVSLPQARMERDKARLVLKEGRDPCHVQTIARLEKRFSDDSFAAIAKEYVDKLRREGRSKTTLEKNEWLLDFARPILGPLSMRAIRPIEILAVLRRVEGRGRYETARRLRSVIGGVFRYAVATARADSDPTVLLRDALTTPTVTPRAALTDAKSFAGLLRAIDAFDGHASTRLALKLMALLFPRPGELRLAEWSEFDWDGKVWNIPALRTKMRRPQRVPLAPQALASLNELRSLARPGVLLFPSARTSNRPISDNTLNAALRRMGYAQNEATAHGFRATASTLLNESGLWNADAIERQLGHLESNDVRRAYARGEHWDERIRMMAWWADYLDRLRDSTDMLRSRGKPVSDVAEAH
ncbi:MAG: tyrosine-type recombinase/integrase [Alphaproteobacteria bacterium]|nr:tyrosine-type recombinase/integrase [Alphaproteobacteria bacterium]